MLFDEAKARAGFDESNPYDRLVIPAKAGLRRHGCRSEHSRSDECRGAIHRARLWLLALFRHSSESWNDGLWMRACLRHSQAQSGFVQAPVPRPQAQAGSQARGGKQMRIDIAKAKVVERRLFDEDLHFIVAGR
jgi:hypothetical protein